MCVCVILFNVLLHFNLDESNLFCIFRINEIPFPWFTRAMFGMHYLNGNPIRPKIKQVVHLLMPNIVYL